MVGKSLNTYVYKVETTNNQNWLIHEEPEENQVTVFLAKLLQLLVDNGIDDPPLLKTPQKRETEGACGGGSAVRFECTLGNLKDSTADFSFKKVVYSLYQNLTNSTFHEGMIRQCMYV